MCHHHLAHTLHFMGGFCITFLVVLTKRRAKAIYSEGTTLAHGLRAQSMIRNPQQRKYEAADVFASSQEAERDAQAVFYY